MEQYSYETGEKRTFHIADYIVCGLTLAGSAAIGLFYAIKDRKRNTTEEYLLAGRGMHPLPVAMSLVSTFISAITILGTPAEVYIHSTMYWWVCPGMLIAALGAGYIFIPVFYRLGITSVFEYIELRFGKLARMILTIVYICNMTLYMAIVLYVPALALNAVTGLSMWGSVIIIGSVCTFYTTLGGMKAVVWADTLQMTIVYVGMMTILIEGCIILGGFGEAWDIADKGGRVVLFEFDLDPRVRHTVWSVTIGAGLTWTANFGVNQATVQRTISVSSVTRTKAAIWLMVPGIIAIVTIACLVGMVMYAFYAGCDPLKFGLIAKADQLFPLYMMDILGKYHGLPGLMLSCIFSGCLSTVSSGLNALSAVMLEDFGKQFCCKSISNQSATLLSKSFSVLFGVIAILIAFIVAQTGGLIIQVTYSLFGMLSGPMLGVFTLGMVFPQANNKGALTGYLTSLGVLLWIGFGTIITDTKSITRWPDRSTESCNWNATESHVTTMSPNTTVTAAQVFPEYSGIQNVYTISYIWYTLIAVIITTVVGQIVSLLTGPTDPETLDPTLICPVFDVFCWWLPENTRKRLRFGVKHEVHDDEEVLTERKSSKARLANLTHREDPIEEGTENGTSKVDYQNPAYDEGAKILD